MIQILYVRLCHGDWTVDEETVTILLLVGTILLAFLSVCTLYKLSSFTFMMNITRKIPKMRIVIHKSLIERLIDARQKMSSNFIQTEHQNKNIWKKKSGYKVPNDKKPMWYEETLEKRLTADDKEIQRIEEILFDQQENINLFYVNSPNSDGSFHIIRNKEIIKENYVNVPRSKTTVETWLDVFS